MTYPGLPSVALGVKARQPPEMGMWGHLLLGPESSGVPSLCAPGFWCAGQVTPQVRDVGQPAR